MHTRLRSNHLEKKKREQTSYWANFYSGLKLSQNKTKLGKGRQQQENITLLTCNGHPTAHATVGFNSKSVANTGETWINAMRYHTNTQIAYSTQRDRTRQDALPQRATRQRTNIHNARRTLNSDDGPRTLSPASRGKKWHPAALRANQTLSWAAHTVASWPFLSTPNHLQKWKRSKYKLYIFGDFKCLRKVSADLQFSLILAPPFGQKR